MVTNEQMEVFRQVYDIYWKQKGQMPSGKQDLAWELILLGETNVSVILNAVRAVGSPMYRPFGEVEKWLRGER